EVIELNQRDEEIKKNLQIFYGHLMIFIVGNIILAIFDYFYITGWFFYWITIIWGIILVGHGYLTYNKNQSLSHNWEKKKIEELKKEDEEFFESKDKKS
ncbi:MAG TPA: 2TM domain-containing protein, partial [Methanobacteriaceae archaeon]|nr:2TM domain-containing protein [Methanobacteriaceae archaeon]